MQILARIDERAHTHTHTHTHTPRTPPCRGITPDVAPPLFQIKVHESGKQLLALVRSEAFLNISASKAALRYLISECVAMGLFKAEPPPKAKVRTFSIPDPTVVQNLRTTFSQYPCHRRNLGLRAPGAGLAAGGGAAGG